LAIEVTFGMTKVLATAVAIRLYAWYKVIKREQCEELIKSENKNILTMRKKRQRVVEK